MKTTLELLEAQYGRAAITDDQLLADWLPQYSSRRTFLKALRAGRLPGLRLQRHGKTSTGQLYITLPDLADWLDNTSNHTQAAA